MGDTPRFSSELITDASQIPFESGIVFLGSHSPCGHDGAGATPGRGRGGALERIPAVRPGGEGGVNLRLGCGVDYRIKLMQKI